MDDCVSPANDGQVSQEAPKVERMTAECLDGFRLVDSQVWLGLRGRLRQLWKVLVDLSVRWGDHSVLLLKA